MRNIFLTVFFFWAALAVAGDNIHFDPINGNELAFGPSQFEKLTIDELNPKEEVDLSFFTFADQEYEKLRKQHLYNTFKKRVLQPSFKRKIDSLAPVSFASAIIEVGYYGTSEYRGYVLERIGLAPVSYLGHTLTFAFSAEMKFNGTDHERFYIVEVFCLNLNDFSYVPIESIHNDLNYDALRNALTRKWQEMQNEMPRINWLPIENRGRRKPQGYGRPAADSGVQKFFADSLISYAVKQGDLREADIHFTGAGVLVQLKNAVPWFSNNGDPMKVQFHLEAYEAKEALRDFEPYRALQNAREPAPPPLPVDPFDHFFEYRFLQVERHYIQYLKLQDSGIAEIIRYYKSSPQDSQFLDRIHYQDGLAQMIDARPNVHLGSYDSIFWKNDRVHHTISQHRERHKRPPEVNEKYYLCAVQDRDRNGNTRWVLSTHPYFKIDQVCYFDKKVAVYRYSILGADLRAFYGKQPTWYTMDERGLCDRKDWCYKVDTEGRPAVAIQNYYVYENGRLRQILGDRDISTLLYYDADGRLKEITQTGRSPEKVRYFYEGDSRFPWRYEESDPRYSSARNYYNKIRRK